MYMVEKRIQGKARRIHQIYMFCHQLSFVLRMGTAALECSVSLLSTQFKQAEKVSGLCSPILVVQVT